MNNKKGQEAMEFLMTYGWAILAAVIVIGVLASFGVFNIVEDFTITKKECSSKLNSASVLCRAGCIFYANASGVWDYKLLNECYNTCGVKSYESCKEIETKKIIQFKSVSSISKINCDEYSEKSWETFYEDGYICYDGYISSVDKIIKKSDLTVAWLDNNCETESNNKWKCQSYYVEVKNE